MIFTSFGQTKGQFNSLDEALKNPVEVKSLYLIQDSITRLPDVILSLENLEELVLDENPNIDLTHTFEQIKHLPNLKGLSLANCGLNKIPDNISELSITELDLSANLINSFPEGIKKMRELIYLVLFDNKLSDLQFSTSDLPKLTKLNLCYNEFTIFPVSLQNLQNLKQLRIWSNKMEIIPDDISKCKKLEELNLDHNKITHLPDNFHKLPSLTILSLDDNNLDPESILVLCKMQNLKKLNLRNTNISSIPKEIGDLNNIITLDLSENKDITKLPKQMTQLKALNQLGLGNLTQMDWEESFDILSKLPNLRAIGLYDIKKQTMPKGFEKLQQVQTFWLTFNLFDNNEKERIKSLIPTAKIIFD